MILGLALAFAAPPARVEAARQAVDWDAVEAESADWLSRYIQIDTVAPPGNERDGAVFLRRILDREGFDTQLVDHGDNRASLIARLSRGGTRPPLCLLSHIDVVPSEPDRWSRQPLSGAVEDGYVWGRGAIDMKGMGIMEVAAAVQIARGGFALDRDLVILAVADEEVSGLGARTLAAEHWDDIGCEYVLNEGGLGQEGALFEGQTVHAISVAERGPLWVRLVAEGEPGHGSVIAAAEAPLRLLEAMERVDRGYRAKTVLSPPIVEMLERIGAHKGGFVGGVLRSGLGRSLIVKGQLAGSNASLVQTTVHLTGMSGASSTNVVPSTVWASYDCRLLPGVEPRALLAELEALTEDLEGVHWEVLSELSSNGSPWEDPFFETLSAYAVEGHPEAVAAPLLSPGFTDSLFLRPVGAKAYGYIPIVIDAKERATMHGDDERLSLENLRHGTRVLFGTVLDFAGAPDGSAFLPALRDELAAIPRGTDPASIGEELALRKAIDQRVRQPEVIHDPDRRVELTLVDVENTRRLREIVATHGWPTVGVFGKDGSRDAWLLAQHADRDPAFQAEVLALIEPLVASGEVRPRDHAYLYDRVAVAEDRPQRFGTQGRCTDAGWEPFAIEDPDGVDGRRAAAGIGWDMATYRQVFDCAGLEAKAKAAYAAKDWPVCAEAYAERAAGGSPNAAVQWYNAACCGALAGDLDGAFDDLGRALEAGFTGDPRKDPDLDGLHADPRWEALGL